MNDVIRLLPDSVANQIAAGEVIQRPASVVKELVENAVDAGASVIKIILKDAGRTLIQVVDNGKGMTPTDARLAFERHSTSKITDAADLFSLHTMGFRGEALASICAVAQVELQTKPADEPLGTHIVINGSKFEKQEPCGCAAGSVMTVKNLFYNVPARRKFLKKDAVELTNIIHEFERLALINPTLEFELYHNDSLLHQLVGGNLKMRIGQLFGKTVERSMVPVEVSTGIVSLSGFVGLPENARRRNALQYFFVNGRNMRHPYFHKAVMSCYEQLIATDVQPNYFLSLEVDPASIDVNIHPTKNEIKFENEQAIWQILVAAIRESLGKFNIAPSINFNVDDSPEIPVFNPTPRTSDFSPFRSESSYNPFATSPDPKEKGKSKPNSALSQRAGDWEKLYEGFASTPSPTNEELRAAATNTADDDDEDFFLSAPAVSTSFIPTERPAGDENDSDETAPQQSNGELIQISNRYILSPAASGVMVVDQHRAHVRVLFEQFYKAVSGTPIASQRVFFPEVLHLSASQNIVLDSIIDNVQQLGFDISFLGDNTWAINAVPSLIGKLNPPDTLLAMIENVMTGAEANDDEMLARIALSMSKAAAIPAGKKLSQPEMEHLISELFKLSTPAFTPDGLRVVAMIGTDAIAGFLKN